jgi:hypothetical protein
METMIDRLGEAVLYGWPNAGLGLAALILAVLFGRPSPRGRPYQERLRDPQWLLWAAVPMYMIHQFEEHGVDCLGRHYAFLEGLCTALGHADLTTCPADARFILAVNVSLVWIVGPVSAALARRRLYVGATFLCTPLINAVVHTVPALIKGEYNPGLVTSIFLFLPVCIYTVHRLRRAGVLDGPRLASLAVFGALLHGVLLATLKAHEAGLIDAAVRDAIQVFNAFTPLVAGFALDRVLTSRRPSAHGRREA